jgi:hypothetical protein
VEGAGPQASNKCINGGANRMTENAPYMTHLRCLKIKGSLAVLSRVTYGFWKS